MAKGQHVEDSFFEWGAYSNSSINGYKEEILNQWPEDKGDILFCTCGSQEIRLYTKEDSDKIEDVVVICVKCNGKLDLPEVLKLVHSA